MKDHVFSNFETYSSLVAGRELKRETERVQLKGANQNERPRESRCGTHTKTRDRESLVAGREPKQEIERVLLQGANQNERSRVSRFRPLGSAFHFLIKHNPSHSGSLSIPNTYAF